MSRKNRFLTYPLVALAIIIFIAGFSFGVKGLSLNSLDKLQELGWLLYTGFALALTGDAYVAISLCILLHRSKTGVGNTNSMINILLAYTINTGLLTMVVSAIEVFTYVGMPNNFIFLAAYFPLSKCYVNAMLATLNAREVLRKNAVQNTTYTTTSSVMYYRPFRDTPGGSTGTEGSDQTFSLGNLRGPTSTVVVGGAMQDHGDQSSLEAQKPKQDSELGGYAAKDVFPS